MPIKLTYALPVDQTGWKIEGKSETVLSWTYDNSRDELLALYDKGKRRQWNADYRIDWSPDLPEDNPMEMPDVQVPIFGSPIWDKLNEKERGRFRRHMQAWQVSQFLHGEQAALVCVARIVTLVPDMDSKFYAATQVMDEARHVEVYSRLLREKFGLAYPMTPALTRIFDTVLRDSRWDFTYLGTQVLVESLGLASFQRIRNQSKNVLAQTINAYVMQDEARHVAFGRLALRDLYPQLTEAERKEREEFVAEACFLLHSRLDFAELWETVDLPRQACVDFVMTSKFLTQFRGALFRRIAPTVKYVGLLGPTLTKAFEQMDVLKYADFDLEARMEEDDRMAREMTQRFAPAAAKKGKGDGPS